MEAAQLHAGGRRRDRRGGLAPLADGRRPRLFPMATSTALPPLDLLLAVWPLGIVAGLASGCSPPWSTAARICSKLPIHWMWWPALGGVVVGIGGLIEPRALGVGYDNIAALLRGDLTASGTLRLLVVKAVIWSIALGSGTSGGVLAPLLIMGGASARCSAGSLPARRHRPLGADRHGGDDGRHHARAADRDRVRPRAHARSQRAAAAGGGLRRGACHDRAAAASARS